MALFEDCSAFEQREAIVITTQGEKIFAILHTPLNAVKAPGAIILHGFAGTKVGSRRLYVELAENLSKSGICTLRFDFRGCGDSEGSFANITVVGQISDALSALDCFSHLKSVNPNRLALIGSSFGGTIAIYAAAHFTPLKALVLLAPVSSGQLWQEDWQRTYPQEVVANHIRCGGETAGKEFCQQFLNIRADEELKKLSHLPLLHMHAAKDRIVFPHHADSFRQARDSVPNSQFHLLEQSNHNFTNNEQERNFVIQQTTTWLANILLH